MKKNEYPAITVDQLLIECLKLKKEGLGQKKILLSSDDEGNEFHGLFYGFITDQTQLNDMNDFGMFHDRVDPQTVVLLG